MVLPRSVQSACSAARRLSILKKERAQASASAAVPPARDLFKRLCRLDPVADVEEARKVLYGLCASNFKTFSGMTVTGVTYAALMAT